MKRLRVLAIVAVGALALGSFALPVEAGSCKHCDGRTCDDAPEGLQSYDKCADGEGFCTTWGSSCTGTAPDCMGGEECQDVQNASVTPNGEASPAFVVRVKTCSVVQTESPVQTEKG